MKKLLMNVDVGIGLIIGIFFGFLLCISYLVFHDDYIRIYAENSLIENIQACLLAIAGTIYFATAVLERRSDKLIVVFCFLLCLAFFLRELDIEDLNIHHALILIGSGAGRNAMLSVGFVAVFVCALAKFSHYKAAAIEFAKSRPGWLLLAGMAFQLLGQFFDKNNAVSHYHVFFEEINELLGYVLILASAIAANSFLCRKKVAAEAAVEDNGAEVNLHCRL